MKIWWTNYLHRTIIIGTLDTTGVLVEVAILRVRIGSFLPTDRFPKSLTKIFFLSSFRGIVACQNFNGFTIITDQVFAGNCGRFENVGKRGGATHEAHVGRALLQARENGGRLREARWSQNIIEIPKTKKIIEETVVENSVETATSDRRCFYQITAANVQMLNKNWH